MDGMWARSEKQSQAGPRFVLSKGIAKELEKSDLLTQAKTITLVANDGTEFQVPVSFAQDTSTIKMLLGGYFQERDLKGDSKVEFKDIDAFDLGIVAAVANVAYKNKDKNLYGKAFLDAIAEQVKIPASIKLLMVFDFLDYELGRNLVSRAIARDEITAIAITKQTLPDNLVTIIARYYSLIHSKIMQKKDLVGVDPKSYGFSIQDYLDYQPHIFKTHRTVNSLILRDLRLNNLDGLVRVPNIATVDFLSFTQNQLKKIEPNAFKGLVNLENLQLDFNQVREIAVDAFKGLARLKYLSLGHNQLQNIQVGALNGLTVLQHLDLTYNQFQQMPTDAFSNVSTLTELSLDDNQLNTIQPGAFNGLIKLQRLGLSSNQLQEISADVFHGLPALRVLFLLYNPLTESSKIAIRAALPHSRVNFVFTW